MAAHKKMERRASGGKAEGPKFEYNAKGSPEMEEANDTKGSFKKGGSVGGEKSKKRLDKRARGGAMKGAAMGRGSSPYSSGASLSPPSKNTRAGHAGEA